MPHRKLTISLPTQGYDILVGTELLAEAGAHIAAAVPRKRVIIITDSEVARYCLAPLRAALDAQKFRHDTVTIPAGEQAKFFAPFEALLDALLALKPDRYTALIALGGGVVGDVTGFAASVLLRGVPFVQVPTTLLAQVDSSVGGKTGINARQGKNLIGTFYQPRLVLADMGALATLPPRQWRAGYAEIVKYGLIGDAAFFEWLERHAKSLLRGEPAPLAEAVYKSCAAKAAIVAQDEKESGIRALLNFGHTFAHALELETGYGDALLHGEAVAVGMVLAFKLSARLGYCGAGHAGRVAAHLHSVGLPASLAEIRPAWNAETLLDHCRQDKKAQDGALTFILARNIGDAFVANGVPANEVRALLTEEAKAA